MVFVSERDSPKCSFQVTFEAARASEAEDQAPNENVVSTIRVRDFIAYAAERFAPHLPPPRRKVERKDNIQIVSNHRAESVGGG